MVIKYRPHKGRNPIIIRPRRRKAFGLEKPARDIILDSELDQAQDFVSVFYRLTKKLVELRGKDQIKASDDPTVKELGIESIPYPTNKRLH